MRRKQSNPPAVPSVAPSRPDAFLSLPLHLRAGVFLAILLALHLHHAATVYLNPDEALHYQLAHQKSWSDAYTANNTNAHPPLLILTLHAMLGLGDSEVFLRLLPVACAIAFAWFAFQWGLLVASPAVAAALCALAALLPPVWHLSTEIRQYVPALCFASAALYFFDAALANRSVPRMLLGALFLCLAALSNYSAVWFCAGFGLYSLFRLWRAAPPRPLAIAWAAGQTSTAALYAWLYVSHIAEISGTEMSRLAKEGWLSSFYCGVDTWNCLYRNTKGLWTYLFASPEIAIPGFALFLAGIAILWTRNRALLLLIGGHLLACIAANSAGLYPFGGTRHSAMLALPLSIPIAFAISWIARARLDWTFAAIAVLLTATWWNSAPDNLTFRKSTHTRRMAADAASYLRRSVPPGGLVFTSHQSMLLLCYYANRQGYCDTPNSGYFWSFDFGGFRLVSSRVWSPSPDVFVEELKILKREYQLRPGAEVWVFDGGWGEPLGSSLVHRFTETVLPGLRAFGPSLTVFRLPN